MKTLIATIAITTSASAGIVTFENLPSTYNSRNGAGEQLTNSVDGFTFTSGAYNWGSQDNWYYYNIPNPYLSSGAYAIGVNGTTALYSGYYNSNTNSTYNISRADGSLWKFNQAVFTSVWAMGNIQLVGFRNGVMVFSLAQNISNTQQTIVSTSSYPGPDDRIDTLMIKNYIANPFYGKHFIMDNMYYTLPAPSVLTMIGIAACGTSNRRRKNTNEN